MLGRKSGKRSLVWSVSKEEFLNRIINSNSIGELLLSFGLQNKGGNYKTITKRCKEESLIQELDDLKLRGKIKSSSKIIIWHKKVPLEDVLVENSSYNRSRLKERLIQEGLLENKCSICEMAPIWNDKIIVFILDHISGVSDDNRIENLRLVCPNCNSQLDTFAGRHKRKIYKCEQCEEETSRGRKFCNKCVVGKQQPKRLFDPTREELEELVWKYPTVQVAKMFDVSDKAIDARCKLYGIEKPPRGYWTGKSKSL